MILPFDKIAGYLAGERLKILQVRTLEERVDASKMTRRYSEELSEPISILTPLSNSLGLDIEMMV